MSTKDMDGVVKTWPGILLRLEGGCLFAACLWAYGYSGAPWWFFASGILVPNLSMLGYLSDPVTGAAIYNAVHTETPPSILLCFGVAHQNQRLIGVALIWLAHINMDRMIGAGLKYGTGFKSTHLGYWKGFKRQEA